VPEQLNAVVRNLRDFGPRRLALMGAVIALVLTVIAVASVYLNRPAYETLYVGLERSDVNQIGLVLGEAGIGFDVASDGTTVLVPSGKTAQARMLLAEKGLPTSASSGYELFDKLGPVGLTSFMQDITRVRALEGEIGRSIQTMRGVKAARVHIVMPDIGSFRRARQAPSASVIVATEGVGDRPPAAAIRHLVAAAVPGLGVEQVTVLSTDGQVLAAGGENVDAAPANMVDLEKSINTELQENIRKTLIPYLGPSNFEVSVAARLNTDKRQTNETIFDPDSRIERSVRSVKENSRSENDGNRAAVTVEQNVPGEQTGALPGDRSKRQNDRKEELTNYELNSKVVSTVSNGYRVENLTIAVVVNRKQLMASLGGQAATPEAVDRQLKELERVVETSAGVDAKRGDRVTVTALDFMSDGSVLPPLPEPGFVDIVSRETGTIVNALAIVVATFLLVWFGLRPALNALLAQPLEPAEATPLAIEGGTREMRPAIADLLEPSDIVDLSAALSTQKKLENVVENYESQAAAIMKQWLKGST
jgi:flagellar M-ring protein FliF